MHTYMLTYRVYLWPIRNNVFILMKYFADKAGVVPVLNSLWVLTRLCIIESKFVHCEYCLEKVSYDCSHSISEAHQLLKTWSNK